MFTLNTLDAYFASLLNHQQMILTISYEPFHIVSLADWLYSSGSSDGTWHVFVGLLHTNTHIRTFQLRQELFLHYIDGD